jgi:Tol biopolymer transport system component
MPFRNLKMRQMLNFILLILSLQSFSCKQDNPIIPSDSGKNEIIVVAEEDSLGVFQLFIRNIDGSNPKQLTHNQFKSYMPSISSKGDYIAYVMESNNSADIYLIKFDGTDNHKITSGGINITPRWVPDSDEILFTHTPTINGSVPQRIYKMNSDGSNKSILINETGIFSEAAPTISPDGNQVAFTSDRSGTEKFEIWKANINGTDLIKLTSVDYDTVVNANIQQKVPAWSPDGKKIAIWRGIEMSELYQDGSPHDEYIIKSWKICIMNSNGSNLIAIDFGDDPTWSNDSKYILHPDPMNRDMNVNNQISVKRHLSDGSDNITLFKTFKNFGRMDIGYINKL